MTELAVEEPVETLVTELERLGVRLWLESGQLKFRAPQGVMTPERRDALRARREELVAHLADGGLSALVADPAGRHEPFPLSDVQSAYLLGRGRAFAYGGVGCHGYGELRYPALDPDRMRRAWQAVIDRHDMLRAVVELDGSQRVLPEVPPFELTVVDLRGKPADEVARGLAEVRDGLDHRVYAVDTWPLFDARVTLTDDFAVMHVSIDFLVADFVSIQVLLDEVHHHYHHPDRPLPPLDVSFRDYLLAERKLRDGAQYDRDRAYWLERIDDLPAGPELPVLTSAPDAPPRFLRWQATIEPELWATLRERAGRHGVSASGAVLAAYTEALAAWSRHPLFTLNLTLLNRLPLHPQVPALIGDFTSVELLAVDATPGGTFADRARDIQARLWQDMDHRSFSGVEVMREITRRKGVDASLFPVVFTSAIGLAGTEAPTSDDTGELGYGISQTPQVWLDCQNMERNGTLATNWDVREGVFPDGVVESAFEAYEGLLRRLATDEAAWTSRHPIALPADQAVKRAEVNATAGPIPAGLLHEPVVAQALSTPDRVAVVGDGHAMTYGELLARATGVADRLTSAGCQPGELVGIVMDRGWEQVVGALGTLLAGGVYVPVDTNSPPARRAQILTAAGISHALTQSWLAGQEWPAGVTAHPVDTLPPAAPRPAQARVEPGDLAYVIHTSGSTGAPKGVMISHRGALNTVVDVNTRFGIGPDDRVLALSNLGFDLSVYDIFGPLAVGGAIVIPSREKPGDPSHWADLVAEHRVTIWNSVPAQLQMTHDYLAAASMVALPSLRLAMLSGDWIPVGLPDAIRQRVPGLSVVSLGGATEASIWSILHPIGEVADGWRSIPYGRPMTNQTFHVLDAQLRHRPDWVAGELFIGGIGVAEGYLNDPARTAERFVTHPETGERIYRTGDLGRYLPGGEIELLGREDFQVKIRGYRIELAEIESATQAHPAVGGAVVLVDGDRPLERRLVAFVEPAPTQAAQAGPDRGLADAAVAAGDEVMAGVDTRRYERFAECLDRIAIPAMASTLTGAGLFATVGDGHTYPEILAAAKVSPRHHRLIRRWLRALTTEGVLAEDGSGYRLARPVDTDVDGLWRELAGLALPGDTGLLDYFRGSIAHLPALLRGEEDPLALLFPEGRLDVSQELYEQALFNRWANRAAGEAVRRLAAAYEAPAARQGSGPLRVLEVGAGGGGTTAAVLAALAGVEVDYCCTDLSPYFLTQAQARFADQPGIRFRAYDLDEDYRAQGLAPNSFDIVIAGDVLHATTNVDRALGRLRELLAPGGALVAVEMTREHYQIMTSLELLVRLDEAAADFTDERQGGDRVFLDRQRWLAALARAGGEARQVLPDEGGFIAELGMCVLVARFKTDRAPCDGPAVGAHLRERLPEYMVPAVIQIVDALPLTSNGKVDRGALRKWLPRREAAANVAVGAAPASDLEQRVAAVWAEALRIGRVGRDDNLFELGGDSLVAAQIAGRLLEDVPEAAGLFFDELLRQLLEQPTVAALTARLASSAAAGSAPAEAEAAPAAGHAPAVHLGGPDRGDAAIAIIHDASLAAGDPLLAHLPSGHPVYAVSGDAADGVALDRLAADTADAVTGVLAAAGAGRVCLAGVGLAATLAVEVGRVLTERGCQVDGVTLVGAYHPRPGDAGGLAEAVRRHEPTLYAGDLTMVRAATGRSAGDEAAQVFEDICLGDLRVVDVDGDHDALLREPYVAAVAVAVAAGLAAAATQAPHGSTAAASKAAHGSTAG